MKGDASKKLQERQTEIFNQFGVGFCFGKNQFEEYVKEQREKGYNGKFVSLGMGIVAHKDNYKEFLKVLEEAHKICKEETQKEYTMDEYIEEQMSNHEVYYTGNYFDTNFVNEVKSIFPKVTQADLARVYKATYFRHDL